MRLFVIRHGETENNHKGTYTGWTQVSLTEKGIEDAKSIRKFLQGFTFDKIYASDLIRAQLTAETALPGCTYESTPLLREINLGDLCGKTVDQCTEEYGEAFLQCRKNRDFVPYGGENNEMIEERAKKFLDMVASSGHACVAAFSHGGMLKTMTRVVLEQKISYSNLSCPNCTIAVYDYAGGKWKLSGWIDPSLVQ